MATIELRGICKRFGKVEALRGWLLEQARAFPPPPGA